jgi:hypothetical protein
MPNELKEIESCRGITWCPVDYDGHCMLKQGVDTIENGIPHNCPLKKAPVILQLKAEVLQNA